MKKTLALILFFLLSISLLASGHGADVVGSALLFLAGLIFCVMGFMVVTVLNIINNSRPGKRRTLVYAILTSFFTLIFLYLLFSSAEGPLTDAGRAMIIGFGVFFILLITLNIFFLVRAFRKLNKQNNKSW